MKYKDFFEISVFSVTITIFLSFNFFIVGLGGNVPDSCILDYLNELILTEKLQF